MCGRGVKEHKSDFVPIFIWFQPCPLFGEKVAGVNQVGCQNCFSGAPFYVLVTKPLSVHDSGLRS